MSFQLPSSASLETTIGGPQPTGTALPSEHIVDLLGARADDLIVAAARQWAQAGRMPKSSKTSLMTERQRAFMREIYGRHEEQKHRRAPVHPGSAGRRFSTARNRKPGPLTEVELMWLNRLPSDPTQVTFDDAAQLATIADSISRDGKHPDHAMLIESVWGPIREHHDALVARHEVERLEASPPRVPDSTLGALSDSLREEVPELSVNESETRARDLLAQAEPRIVANHHRALEQARARVAEAEKAHELRTRMTVDSGQAIR